MIRKYDRLEYLERQPLIRYDGEHNPQILQTILSNKNNVRFETLQNYYEGKSRIWDRPCIDHKKPHNKLVSGYPSYIVDVIQGYFVGVPVIYSSEDEQAISDLQDVFNYNDEQDENSELAKMMGIKGEGYEIVYLDEEANIRFDEIDPTEMTVVYTTDITPEINFAIRTFESLDMETGEQVLHIHVYDQYNITEYIQSDGDIKEVNQYLHHFSQVPVVAFLNNDERMGDFERVISLIDAYDQSNSDTANDFEEFTDAFLCLVNLNATDEDDIEDLKENKVLLLDEKGQAYWLIKEINDSALENFKKRLDDDIHKFTKTPNITDTNFSGTASGESLKYKLMALDQVVAVKERKFKRALQKRIELIFEILNIKKSTDYDWRTVELKFTRNRPRNIKEEVETAKLLQGFTSESTAIASLPSEIVEEPDLEMEKIQNERGTYSDWNPDGGMEQLQMVAEMSQEGQDNMVDVIRESRS